MKTKQEQKQSALKNEVILANSVLESLFLYDERVREFLVQCRFFISVVASRGGRIDDDIIGEILTRADQYVPTLIRHYNQAYNELVLIPTESSTSFVTNTSSRFFPPHESKNTEEIGKLHSSLRYAFRNTVRLTIRSNTFKFNPDELIKLYLRMGPMRPGLINMLLVRSTEFIFEKELSAISAFLTLTPATKEKAQIKLKKIFRTLPKPQPPTARLPTTQKLQKLILLLAIFSALDHFFGLTQPEISSFLFTLSLIGLLFVWEYKRDQLYEPLTNNKQKIAYLIALLAALYMVKNLSHDNSIGYNLLVWAVVGTILEIFHNKDDIIKLYSLQRGVLSTNTLGRIKIYEKEVIPPTPENKIVDGITSGTIIFEDVLPTTTAPKKQSTETVDNRSTSAEPQTRRSGTREGKSETKTNSTPSTHDQNVKKDPPQSLPPIHFPSLGLEARCNYNNLSYESKAKDKSKAEESLNLPSTVFPCETFDVKGRFVHIDTHLLDELDGIRENMAATKFKSLAVRAKSAAASNEEGIKILPRKYIKLSNGEFSPCFELKALHKQGGKRLLGCMEPVQADDGKIYQIIIFRVFVPDHTDQALERGLRQLQQKITDAPSHAPPPLEAKGGVRR